MVRRRPEGRAIPDAHNIVRAWIWQHLHDGHRTSGTLKIRRWRRRHRLPHEMGLGQALGVCARRLSGLPIPAWSGSTSARLRLN